MRIGLIFAMDIEKHAFLQQFKHHTVKPLDAFEGFLIELKDDQLMGVLCGVGKVQAAYTTTRLIEHYDLDLIINVGVAGGLALQPQSILVADEVVYHDVDLTAFNYEHGALPQQTTPFKADLNLLERVHTLDNSGPFDVHIGMLASGDQFVTHKETLKGILKRFPHVEAVDMEAAAIAHVATLKKTPFFIVRAISDTLGSEAQTHDFKTFVEKASIQAAKLVVKVVGIDAN